MDEGTGIAFPLSTLETTLDQVAIVATPSNNWVGASAAVVAKIRDKYPDGLPPSRNRTLPDGTVKVVPNRVLLEHPTVDSALWVWNRGTIAVPRYEQQLLGLNHDGAECPTFGPHIHQWGNIYLDPVYRNVDYCDPDDFDSETQECVFRGKHPSTVGLPTGYISGAISICSDTAVRRSLPDPFSSRIEWISSGASELRAT